MLRRVPYCGIPPVTMIFMWSSRSIAALSRDSHLRGDRLYPDTGRDAGEHGVVDVRRLARTQDRCDDGAAPTKPGQCDLCTADASRLSDGGHGLDDRAIARFVRVEHLGEGIGLGPLCRFIWATGQAATRERTPDDRSDSFVGAERQHLPLLLAGEKIVMVLHRDEPRPAILALEVQNLA